MNTKLGKEIRTGNAVGTCDLQSQVPTVHDLMAVHVVLSLGLTYSK